MSDPLPHIKVINRDDKSWSSAEQYRARPAIPEHQRLPERDRHSHGNALLGHLADIGREADAIRARQKSEDLEQTGVIIVFALEYSKKVPFESFETRRGKNRVKDIRILSCIESDNRLHLQVYVPQGQLQIFEKKIQEYLVDQFDEAGNPASPRHEKFAANIYSIHLATLRSLWSDPAPLPDDDVLRWWEIWLWRDPALAEPMEQFTAQAQRIGVEVANWSVTFPERVVTAVRATQGHLTDSIQLLNFIAEVRSHSDLSEFVRRMPNQEQFEWVEDLQARIVAPPEDSPAVCLLDSGVTSEHPLLRMVFNHGHNYTITHCQTVKDEIGHGTRMAGLAAYGDFSPLFVRNDSIAVENHLEAVKLVKHNGDNAGKNTAALIEQAICLIEDRAGVKKRVFCLAVSCPGISTDGIPTAHSAVIDKLTFSRDGDKRLFVVCAGNVPQYYWHAYPESNFGLEVHDPGQSWNALTVGAYTSKDQFNDEKKEFRDWSLLARRGRLAPGSSTSLPWRDGNFYGRWPLKPDIVMEGGNALIRADKEAVHPHEGLSLLTTAELKTNKQFETFGDTSGATALASRLAARITARYPEYWPETVRGLMVHSAYWTTAMLEHFRCENPDKAKARDMLDLVRCYGYGVPQQEKTLTSNRNFLTLIYQEEIQPFNEDVSPTTNNEMALHELPLPKNELRLLDNQIVKLRVTLSYFIEPNPSLRSRDKRYRYESCGLRFRLQPSGQSLSDFRHSINALAREEEEGDPLKVVEEGWWIGVNGRTTGSLHCDIWRGHAIDLVNRDYIAVYPTMGWWRTNRSHHRGNERIRYSLLVSLEIQNEDVDIYTPVLQMVETPAEEVPGV